MFQLWQDTIGDDFGMLGMGTKVSFRTDVQSHSRVRFFAGAAAVPGGADFDAIGIGEGPNFSEEPPSGVPGSERGF